MAITRKIIRVDIQWDVADPVLTIFGEIADDVEGTVADKHFMTKRSDMGAGGQTKFDAFLADVLAYAGTKVAGPIAFPAGP